MGIRHVNKQKLIPWLVVAAGLLAYHNSFTGPFIFDDLRSIPENPTIRHLWPIWGVLSPPSLSGVGGRPVVNFSLAVNYAFGGYNVWGYHALNLAVHLLAGLTLLGVVRRTLLQPRLREQFGVVANELALAVAILWTIHPLQTEAVNYISERCELLMGLFYLLTLYGFIRGTDGQGSSGWFALSVTACLLGMASMEVMVTAPVMVLLYDRTFVSGSFREAWSRHRQLYLGLAGSWVFLGWLMVGLHHRGVGYGLGISWWAYALTECRAVMCYLWLAIWPHPLVFDYGESVAIRYIGEVAPYAMMLAVLVAGVLVELKRRPAIGLVGAWFFLILAPTSSVVPVTGQLMAEYRMYLPLVAVVVLGVMEIYVLIGRRTVPVVVVLAVALGVLTWQRNQDYRSDIAIWEDTVAKCPQNSRAQDYLGNALRLSGRIPEAIEHLERALSMKPNFAEAHYNLGVALGQAGSLPEATEHLEQAVRLKPDYPEAHCNLGVALAQAGRIPEAMEHLEEALRLKPDYAKAHYNLGYALEQEGKIDDAIAHYEQALRLKTDYADARNALARLQARR
jgi:tetratricopeptide (TPR) repeat protein